VQTITGGMTEVFSASKKRLDRYQLTEVTDIQPRKCFVKID